MKHLFPYSVYHREGIQGAKDLISSGSDGVELLTGFNPIDPSFSDVADGVHLPYATDWYSSWSGNADVTDMTDHDIKFIHYGRDRDDMVKTLRTAIEQASGIDPAYGVLHGGSVKMEEVFIKDRVTYDDKVIDALAEMINSTVSEFVAGPPFTILFENLWWSGIKLIDANEMKRLERKLEFDDWGFCLDTGHMMNALECSEEKESIETLIKIFDKIPEDMKERMVTMHLHLSTSYDYRRSFVAPDITGKSPQEILTLAYEHVCKIDQHRPFTIPECAALVNEIHPDFVTHEIYNARSDDSGLLKQRSFFP